LILKENSLPIKGIRNGIERDSKWTGGGGAVLTEAGSLGLFSIQRYRFLTVDQYSRITSLLHDTASKQLLRYERGGLLGFLGNTGIRGYGKTPKVYFLTRKGFELLHRECGIPLELLGTHKEIKVESRWSPQMYHRLRTVDLLVSLEIAVRSRPRLAIVKTFLEYRRVKRGNRIERETTDYVAGEETSGNRIVPDAAFILENRESGKRALFLLEMDMATERIVSVMFRDNPSSLHTKFAQYDRYLNSMRYSQKYKDFGDFGYFTMLFVTLSSERVQNTRSEMRDLSSELADYYRLTTFDAAMGDFLAGNWQSRALSDTAVYPLVREEVTGSG
jgi:hypothetical protein